MAGGKPRLSRSFARALDAEVGRFNSSFNPTDVVKLFDIRQNGTSPVRGFETGVRANFYTGARRTVVDSTSFRLESLITPLDRRGRVLFDGVEFRAVRDLGHMSESQLTKMLQTGTNPKDSYGKLLIGHHHKQKFHRHNDAFIVEIPAPNHSIKNKVQHPFGNAKGRGLTPSQRQDWNKIKKQFNKERAKEEFLKRGDYHE